MKKILFISYLVNQPGSCQAEWADDKIYELIKQGHKVTILSATHCNKINNTDHLRIPSLFLSDAKKEFLEIKSGNIKNNLPFITKLYLKIASYSFINIFKGEGRWSWMFSSTIGGACILLKKKHDVIFSTGGPPSAHISGIILSKIFRKKNIVELQDPLSGNDIGRNDNSKKWLKNIENFIVKNSHRTIYVTQLAALNAKNTYPKFKNKIDAIYPGSRVENSNTVIKKIDLSNINFVYAGSLYQTRDLENFFKALENIKNIKYSINLYGWVAEPLNVKYKKLNNKNIKFNGVVDRDKITEINKNADVLLLVQHHDDRSTLTIPFKLYDYLNTGNIIFGLTYNNPELNEILESNGHYACDTSNISQIEKTIKKLNDDIFNDNIRIKKSNITLNNSITKLLMLYDEI